MNKLRNKIRGHLSHNPDAQSMAMLVCLYVVMFGVFAIKAPSFLTLRNFSNIFLNVSELGIMAVGVAMVVITGRIDLSISSTYCFTGVLIAMLMLEGVPAGAAIAAAFACAAVVGLVNGIFIGYMNLQPVLVTIGTQTLVRGLCYIRSGSTTMMVKGISPAFEAFGSFRLFGVFPLSFLAMLLMLALLYVALKRTRFGIMLLSIGNNPETTRLSGYNTKRSICLIYVMNSLFACLAGAFMITRLLGIEATYGNGYDFQVLTIVLMGGIAFGGGKGNSIGLFLATLALGILQNGMNLMSISTLYQSALIGIAVLMLIARPDIQGMKATLAAKREVKRLNEAHNAQSAPGK